MLVFGLISRKFQDESLALAVLPCVEVWCCFRWAELSAQPMGHERPHLVLTWAAKPSGPSAKVQRTPGGALGPWESSPASGLVSDPTSLFPIFSELKTFSPCFC